MGAKESPRLPALHGPQALFAGAPGQSKAALE